MPVRRVLSPPQIRRTGLVLAGVLALAAGTLGVAEYGRFQLERRLSRFFQVPVRVQGLSISPARMTLRQVSFSWAGLPLKAQGRLFFEKASAAGENPPCEGWLMLEHPFLEGRVEISGSVREPIFLGWIQGPGGRRHFVGRLEFGPDEIRLARLDVQGGVTLSGRLMKGTERKGRLLLYLYPAAAAGGSRTTALWPEEQAPVGMELAWEPVSRSGLKIHGQTLDGQVSLEGRWDPKAPDPLEAALQFQEASLSELLAWVLPRKDRPRLEGWVRGRIQLNQLADRLISQGELFAQEIRFNAARFDELTLRFRGTGPWFQIQDSHMARPGEVLRMEGLLDLRRLGQPTFFKEVRLTPADKSLNWNGWKMTPLGSGLQVQRQAAQDRVEVGFSYEMDGQVQPEPVQREGVEVGMPIAPDKRLQVRMDREGEFLGVEHRKQF